MSCGDDWDALHASLGTCFERDRERDMVRVTAADGTEIEVPGPDLRECLSWLSSEATVPAPSPYGELLDRSRARLREVEVRVSREERDAQRALVDLLGRGREERTALVAADERLRTYSLARRAAEQSRNHVLVDPTMSFELALLGREIASQLDPQIYGAGVYRSRLRERASSHRRPPWGDPRLQAGPRLPRPWRRRSVRDARGRGSRVLALAQHEGFSPGARTGGAPRRGQPRTGADRSRRSRPPEARNGSR